MSARVIAVACELLVGGVVQSAWPGMGAPALEDAIAELLADADEVPLTKDVAVPLLPDPEPLPDTDVP